MLNVVQTYQAIGIYSLPLLNEIPTSWGTVNIYLNQRLQSMWRLFRKRDGIKSSFFDPNDFQISPEESETAWRKEVSSRFRVAELLSLENELHRKLGLASLKFSLASESGKFPSTPKTQPVLYPLPAHIEGFLPVCAKQQNGFQEFFFQGLIPERPLLVLYYHSPTNCQTSSNFSFSMFGRLVSHLADDLGLEPVIIAFEELEPGKQLHQRESEHANGFLQSGVPIRRAPIDCRSDILKINSCLGAARWVAQTSGGVVVTVAPSNSLLAFQSSFLAGGGLPTILTDEKESMIPLSFWNELKLPRVGTFNTDAAKLLKELEPILRASQANLAA